MSVKLKGTAYDVYKDGERIGKVYLNDRSEWHAAFAARGSKYDTSLSKHFEKKYAVDSLVYKWNMMYPKKEAADV